VSIVDGAVIARLCCRSIPVGEAKIAFPWLHFPERARSVTVAAVRMLLLVLPLLAATRAAAAEPARTVAQDAFACVSWAAWHEYSLASLTPKGARSSRFCPRRLAAGTKVLLVEDDAGEGASRIRYRGQVWFIYSQRLR